MHGERREAGIEDGGTDWCVVCVVQTPASLRLPALAVRYVQLLGVFLGVLAGLHGDKRLSMDMEDCLFPVTRGRSRQERASPTPGAELLPFPRAQALAPRSSGPVYAMAGVAGRRESRPAASPSRIPPRAFCC